MDRDNIQWVTINGTHVPIINGKPDYSKLSQKKYEKTKHYLRQFGTGIHAFIKEEDYNPARDKVIEFSEQEIQDACDDVVGNVKDYDWQKRTDYGELANKMIEKIKEITGDEFAKSNTYALWINAATAKIKEYKAEQFLKTMPKLETTDYAEILYGTNRSNYLKSLDAPYGSAERDMYTSNCQRCVQAWYLRHLGYDVEAMPYSGEESRWGTFEKDSSNAKIHGWGWSTSMFIRSTLKTSFEGANKQWASTQLKQIKDIATADGPGACYILSLDWRGCKYAHVCIVHNDNGVVKFIDPQTSKEGREVYFDPHVYRLVTENTKLTRIDQAKLNGEVINEIVKARDQQSK